MGHETGCMGGGLSRGVYSAWLHVASEGHMQIASCKLRMQLNVVGVGKPAKSCKETVRDSCWLYIPVYACVQCMKPYTTGVSFHFSFHFIIILELHLVIDYFPGSLVAQESLNNKA